MSNFVFHVVTEARVRSVPYSQPPHLYAGKCKKSIASSSVLLSFQKQRRRILRCRTVYVSFGVDVFCFPLRQNNFIFYLHFFFFFKSIRIWKQLVAFLSVIFHFNSSSSELAVHQQIVNFGAQLKRSQKSCP